MGFLKPPKIKAPPPPPPPPPPPSKEELAQKAHNTRYLPKDGKVYSGQKGLDFLAVVSGNPTSKQKKEAEIEAREQKARDKAEAEEKAREAKRKAEAEEARQRELDKENKRKGRRSTITSRGGTVRQPKGGLLDTTETTGRLSLLG